MVVNTTWHCSDIIKATCRLLVVVLTKTRHRAHVVIVLAFCARLFGSVFARVSLHIL